AERRSLRGQLKMATTAVASTDKTSRHVKANVDKTVEKTRAKLRDELREELKKELKDQRPLHEKVLTTAIRSAATAAGPIVLKQTEGRTGFGAGARAKKKAAR